MNIAVVRSRASDAPTGEGCTAVSHEYRGGPVARKRCSWVGAAQIITNLPCLCLGASLQLRALPVGKTH
jgi:hypothetical protein